MIAANLIIGVGRPYPGVALGSGLLLIVERTAATWTIVLAALVIADQALKGRLPDEISGRGVHYATQQQLDEISDDATDAGTALLDRVADIEERLEPLEQDVDKTLRPTPNTSRVDS